ncbi:helix-turn-helix domain-containing protein [Acuticoccus sp. I52.16.1]|uniref:helix-turn-helix domain-containing protein n=1 Tax=Acuticoccus sp. I52.16.1 TaxID=2928472 RepID=UPI001FD6177E|nr:helix-turn-helix domain-containing protein [Acuticoccus sp. I52.16.1]UOM34865.1 helix-turn-helix domain-containing protein [Acuticoccus sp. I52.16.1]
MQDPLADTHVTMLSRPPSSGPGSGKDAWRAYAVAMSDGNEYLWSLLEHQSAAIRELTAEVELLRTQIATRKPKGGRPRTPDQTVRRIEASLAEGLSVREAAARHGVSPMTVARIGQRAKARAQSGERGLKASDEG